MKRNKNLRKLSSDHHSALSLARKIDKATKDNQDHYDFTHQVIEIFNNDLLPHFTIEEQAILPELKKIGQRELVSKTLEDHAQLKSLANNLVQPGNLRKFGKLLKDHVRFEEKILFEACQNLLDDAALNSIGYLSCCNPSQPENGN